MAILTGKFRSALRLYRPTLVAAMILMLVAGFGLAARAATLDASISVSPLSVARSQHTATLLPDGRVLVVGGNSFVSGAEIYDPATNEWQNAGNMSVIRNGHSATLLPNGQVFVVGSSVSTFFSQTTIPAELYDPATNRWTRTSTPDFPRSGQTATLLADGSVLVAGGNASVTAAERYTPATATWSDAGNMRTVHQQAIATLLPDGRVFVLGGQSTQAQAEIYNPNQNTWQVSTKFTTPVIGGQTATLLPDGRVLVAGGFSTSNLYYPPPFAQLPAATEFYSPTGNIWTQGPSMNIGRGGHTSTLLPDGRVMVVGGYVGNGRISGSVEIYDPAQNQWYLARDLATPRWDHTATLLADGTVLIVGGVGAGGQLTSVERYDPRDAVLDIRHYLPWVGTNRQTPTPYPIFTFTPTSTPALRTSKPN